MGKIAHTDPAKFGRHRDAKQAASLSDCASYPPCVIIGSLCQVCYLFGLSDSQAVAALGFGGCFGLPLKPIALIEAVAVGGSFCGIKLWGTRLSSWSSCSSFCFMVFRIAFLYE
jgi:hypothetical protein